MIVECCIVFRGSMKLYCMRHGQAVDAAIDAQRALSDCGADQVRRLATHLSEAHINFSHVISSDKLRTRQTAEIMSEIIAPTVKIHSSSCLTNNQDCSDLLQEIACWNDDTLLVGHLPMIDDLVNSLLMRMHGRCPINFIPATIVCLEKRQLLDWDLSWIINPTLLKAE
jgi:phosphohistidine phosphatase